MALRGRAVLRAPLQASAAVITILSYQLSSCVSVPAASTATASGLEDVNVINDEMPSQSEPARLPTSTPFENVSRIWVACVPPCSKRSVEAGNDAVIATAETGAVTLAVTLSVLPADTSDEPKVPLITAAPGARPRRRVPITSTTVMSLDMKVVCEVTS